MVFEEPGSSSKTPIIFTGPTFFEVLEALRNVQFKAAATHRFMEIYRCPPIAVTVGLGGFRHLPVNSDCMANILPVSK